MASIDRKELSMVLVDLVSSKLMTCDTTQVAGIIEGIDALVSKTRPYLLNRDTIVSVYWDALREDDALLDFVMACSQRFSIEYDAYDIYCERLDRFNGNLAKVVLDEDWDKFFTVEENATPDVFSVSEYPWLVFIVAVIGHWPKIRLDPAVRTTINQSKTVADG